MFILAYLFEFLLDVEILHVLFCGSQQLNNLTGSSLKGTGAVQQLLDTPIESMNRTEARAQSRLR
jgi:hypothetical protein